MSGAISTAIEATLAWAGREKLTPAEFEDLSLRTLGLSSQYVYRRRNDWATGAINSGDGPTEPVQLQVLGASNDAPLRKILAGIAPPLPADFEVGGAMIYHAWWEYSYSPDGPWSKGRPTMPFSDELRAWTRLSYEVGVNPLPELRKRGYKAQFCRDHVLLSKDGAPPVRVDLS